MTRFVMTIGLRGNNGRVSNQRFDLGDFTGATAGDDFIAALSAADQIAGAYDTITNAEIAYVNVSHSMPAHESGVIPALGVDVHDYATVSCYLSAPGAAEKLTTVKVIAPVSGIFAGVEGVLAEKVDPTDADLVQFIQQLSQHAFVSDGEQINTATGQNGIKGGRKNSRSYRLPSTL